MTCCACFRELAHVRVDLGEGPPLYCHRMCLETWVVAIDGEWFIDGAIMWASWLSGNMARVVRALDYYWFQVFNSQGVVGVGRAESLLYAQTKAEAMAS